jgi:hypothetical protein
MTNKAYASFWPILLLLNLFSFFFFSISIN